jgi:hypothetical protein
MVDHPLHLPVEVVGIAGVHGLKLRPRLEDFRNGGLRRDNARHPSLGTLKEGKGESFLMPAGQDECVGLPPHVVQFVPLNESGDGNGVGVIRSRDRLPHVVEEIPVASDR